MTIGYFHRGGASPLVAAMVSSALRAMPTVPILRLPDLGGPMALAVLESYASVEGEWLFLDTDVVVQENLVPVFRQAFDLAVASRSGTLRDKEIGTTFMARMPYNKGAVYSRSQAFWHAAVDRCRALSTARQEWMGDQMAMNDVIAAGRFTVSVLESRYNYAPHEATEDVSGMAVVHYKGNRKAWMLGRAA